MANWSFCYYRSKLTPDEQNIYDAVYNGWMSRNRSIRIPGNSSSDAISNAVIAVSNDHPEIFWVNIYRYTATSSFFFSELYFEFFFDNHTINFWQSEATAWQQRIANKFPTNFHGKDRIWLLYDYLARQVTYGEEGPEYSHNIIGPLRKNNHVAVCEGVAKSFKFLCDKINIPCIVVEGDAFFGPGNSGPHAWNIVEYNGIYRHIDVTAEISPAHFSGKATEKNFLHTDFEMTQYSWNTRLTPSCR